MAKPAEHKVVMLGTGGVGKSALTIQFVESYFVTEYDPTIEDSFRKQMHVDAEPVVLDILDTAGQEEYSSMRAQYLRTGHGFVAVYSVTSRSSFNELKILCEQVRRAKDSDTVPMVVVGNKIDLEDEREVSTEEARAYAQSIRCGFVEVSAKENINVEQPFHEVVRLIRFQQRAAAGDQPPMARPVSDGGPTAVASGGQSSVSNEAVLSVLAYLFTWLSGLLLLLLDSTPYVRFHASQSIALFIFYFPILIIAIIVDAIIAATTLAYFISVFVLIVWILFYGLSIFLMIRAYMDCNTRYFRLPGVSKVADYLNARINPPQQPQGAPGV